MGVIQAVIFDLYGTLIRLTNTERIYRELLVYAGVTRIGRAYFQAMVKDYQSLREFIQAIRPQAAELPYFLEKIADFEARLQKQVESAKLHDDAKGALAKLRRSGLRLGLISNLASHYKKPVYTLKVDGETLDGFFSSIAFSCQEGILKPHKAIYQKVLDDLGLRADECLIVGNSLKNDVKGPLLLNYPNPGMQAAYLVRDPLRQEPLSKSMKVRPGVHIVNSLEEIPELASRMPHL